jgi:protoporphyrinogen oxidase
LILIIGGGLAGMSTAYHLGDVPHLVLEGQEHPGGLCRSRDVSGFVFDYTGHLLHMRDQRIVDLVDDLLPDAFDQVARCARIQTHGAMLPFPFQANLHGLPPEVIADCLTGFIQSTNVEVPEDERVSFEEWSLAVFGAGISKTFMLPYNQKLFRREPSRMTADWVSWAVPKPNMEEVVRGALGLENRAMGYNPTFRYPKQGGIGVLPEALAGRVKNMRTGARVDAVDIDRRQVRLTDGETLDYETLVVTTPLPGFLSMLGDSAPELAALGDRLDWSVVGCLNLGIDRFFNDTATTEIYTPDDDMPFYRVGFPSNFSDTVSPPGTSSMYVEFGLKRDDPFDPEGLEKQAIAALTGAGIPCRSSPNAGSG